MRDDTHPLALASSALTARHLGDLTVVRDHPAVAQDAGAGLADEVRNWFAGTVQHQVLRLVITDFHAFRERHGGQPDPTSNTALRAYAERLSDPSALAGIWADAGRLAPRLTRLASQAESAVVEILDHFLADRAELARRGLMDVDDRIAGLGLAQGDTHEEGRSVTVVRLASGASLVHKPRSLALDEHLPRLWGVLDADLRHSLTGCVPASASFGDHGWQEFVAREADLSEAQCERFYYRFGALTAVAALWGSTDLHHENVLVRGERPVIIDAETVLQPDVGAPDALDPATAEMLSATPLGTLLLPVRDTASVMDVLLSGLGVPWAQTSEQTVFQIADENSDAFSVRRQHWSVAQEANVPFIGAMPQNPLVWYSALKAGYLDALTAVRRNEDALAEALRSLPNEATVRFVFRATEVYGRYLDALTHPAPLANADAEEEVLDLLRAPGDAGADPEWLVSSERRQLRRGDVPLFTVGVLDTHANGAGRSPAPVFRSSAVDAAIARTRIGLGLSEELHLLILETCCSELGRGPEPRTVDDALFRPLLAGPGVDRWHDALGALALRTSNDEGHDDWGWCGGTGIGGNTFDSGASISLHDLGGPPAFLRRYARATGRRAAEASAAMAGWRRRVGIVGPILAEMPWSVLGGAASAPLVLGEEGLELLLASADARDVTPAARALDVAHGSAGLVALLAGVPRGPAAEAVLRDHAERVAQQLADPEVAVDHDLLHGRLGLWWALLRAGRSLGRPDWVGRATVALDAAAGSLPDGALRGWCNGAAGVALAAADAGLPEASVEELLARALTLDAASAVDVSVCHGEAGIAQVLAWIDARRGSGPGRARDHLSRAFAQARQHGFHTGMHGHTALLGYALGWSGVADTVLLLDEPDAQLGFPVALEVDPSPVDSAPQPPNESWPLARPSAVPPTVASSVA
ncbi:MAG: DUF4135 domain-containing protein [Propionibacteriaceae bacterium]|nr:DUF4135 domain-containing protein [Propionibacteriaceae bacterium]